MRKKMVYLVKIPLLGNESGIFILGHFSQYHLHTVDIAKEFAIFRVQNTTGCNACNCFD